MYPHFIQLPEALHRLLRQSIGDLHRLIRILHHRLRQIADGSQIRRKDPCVPVLIQISAAPREDIFLILEERRGNIPAPRPGKGLDHMVIHIDLKIISHNNVIDERHAIWLLNSKEKITSA